MQFRNLLTFVGHSGDKTFKLGSGSIPIFEAVKKIGMLLRARVFCCLLALATSPLWLGGAANATLIDNGILIYDDVLNITWLEDANYAETSGFRPGVPPSGSGAGRMDWNSAEDWVTTLVYGGYADWRFPTMDRNGDGIIVDCRSVTALECQDNELGWLHTQVSPAGPGPFSNFEPFSLYYSGTEYAPDTSEVWAEAFADGVVNPIHVAKTADVQHHGYWVWPVRSGGAVPEPTTGLLLGLGLLGVAARRRV